MLSVSRRLACAPTKSFVSNLELIQSRSLREAEAFMNFSSSSPQLRISGSVREIVNEDGAVLLDIKQGLCFSINPAGTRIWEMVKKGCSVEQIEEALQSEFAISRAQIEDDVRDFMENLITAKLVFDSTQGVL